MRTGFYLRVLQPGMANAGDNWELENRSNDPVSVNFVNQAAYRGVEPEVFERIMMAEGVVPEWKEMLRAGWGRGVISNQ
jgi:MOSC domain-containing protein YiiM